MARSVWLGILATGVVLIALAGCRSIDAPASVRVTARFFLEARPDESGVPVVLPQSEVSILLSPRPIFAEFDIATVSVAQVELGRCLWFQLTPAAARDLYRFTAQAQGRRLVLVVDGQPLGARRLQGPLSDGVIAIFVEVPDGELPAMAESFMRTSAALQREASRM